MNLLFRILAVLTGAVFIFSGLVKLIDPIGMSLKLQEFFDVFAEDDKYLYLSIFSFLWNFLKPWSLQLGILLSSAEVVLGVCLLTFYRIRTALWFLLFLVIFFAFLTFYAAYFDVVKDCGCFGDFIKFSPWGSFMKDMILAIPIAVLFYNRSVLEPVFVNRVGMITFWGAVVFSMALPLHALWHLPPVDFRPYAVGKNIPKQMKPSKPLKYGKEVYILTNLETGKDEEFQADEDWAGALADTNKYKYKDYTKPLLNPEDQAKITDFLVFDAEGKEQNEEVFKGQKLLILFHKVDKIKFSMEFLTPLLKDLKDSKVKVWGVTSSGKEDFDKLMKKNKLKLPYYSLDEKVVKTVVRSSPGIVLLDNGVVKGKWHYHNTPSKKTILGKLK